MTFLTHTGLASYLETISVEHRNLMRSYEFRKEMVVESDQRHVFTLTTLFVKATNPSIFYSESPDYVQS